MGFGEKVNPKSRWHKKHKASALPPAPSLPKEEITERTIIVKADEPKRPFWKLLAKRIFKKRKPNGK